MSFEWSPSLILDNKVSCGLIILNQPIINFEAFQLIWKNTKVHICADGGLNRLLDLLPPSKVQYFIPDYVIGDFDSLAPATRQVYSQYNTKFINAFNQEKTDFEKSLDYLYSLFIEDVDCYVLGGLTGRFDHTIAVLHTLYKYLDKKIVVLSHESSVWMLQKGKHLINVNTKTDGPTCGVFSMKGRAVCKTQGLKWDLGTYC